MDNMILRGKRVLVVEDEMLVLMSLEDLLSDLGCMSIAVAGNVGAAVRLIGLNVFDLATLDVNLDGALSYPVAEALEQRHIPFAFSTGYSELSVSREYAGHPILRKPFSRTQFVNVIRGLLTLGSPPALAA